MGTCGLTFLISAATTPPSNRPKVVEHNRIHRPRHEEPQTIAIGRGNQVVSALLQLAQLGRIPMYAQ